MATVTQMEGLLPGSWDLLGLSGAYAVCKAATFLLVRAMGYVSEVRYPGALRERLWSTVGYRSYFVQFYPGRGFSKNFLRHTVLHASVGAATTLALTKVWSPLRVRMACANKRAAEFASLQLLLMLGSLQIVPNRLLKLACVCGEQLADGEALWAYRRAMSRTQVLEDVCINATIHCAQKGFAAYWCGDVLCRHHEGFSWTHRRCQLGLFLRFLDHFVVPCAGVTLGHALGGLMRPYFAELDQGSGIVYNMAWSCEFLMTNLWLAFRVSTLPRLLRRVAPHLAEPDVVLMAAEFDRLTMLSAVAFEGKTPEQLVRIRLELSKAVRGDPTANLVLGGHRRPTQTEALELLDCLDRHEQRQRGLVDWIHANTTLLTPDDSRGLDQCCICLVDFTPSTPVRQLKCKHCYCAECIERWLLKEDKCPLCKSQALRARPWGQVAVMTILRVVHAFLSVHLPCYDNEFLDELVIVLKDRALAYLMPPKQPTTA
eukprot:Rhum_TRINITY_DN16791_c0_g1::Rhum_TRINITY_DN16791_c0_g1_i1::g.164401::m.164401